MPVHVKARDAAPVGTAGRLDVPVRPVLWCMILAMLTSSFDIFLAVDAGFNFRVAQLFLLLPLGAGLVRAWDGSVRVPIGFPWLLLWCAFIVAFVPNTTLLVRSVGYALWLLFSVAVIFATVQVFRTPGTAATLLRWYLLSFLFVATFGIIQFAMPLLGLGAPLVTQWWFPGVLPRVNGFSYEPSYFATYLLLGWVLSMYLLEQRSSVMSRRLLGVVASVLTVALVLSSSRMGWLMMILWFSRYPVTFLLRFARGRVNRRVLRYSLVLAAIAAAAGVVLGSVVGWDTVRFLAGGLGFAGAADHSVAARFEALGDVLRAFTRSPVIGYSLGGVSPALAQVHGSLAGSLAQAKETEGISIFAEVLAGSGIVGVIPFLIYMALVVCLPLRLARLAPDREHRLMLVGMTAALIVELVVLQFNQNILRPYLWIHIALLSAFYAAVKAHNVAGRLPASRPSSASASRGRAPGETPALVR